MAHSQKKKMPEPPVVRQVRAMTVVKPHPAPANDETRPDPACQSSWHPTGGPFPTD